MICTIEQKNLPKITSKFKCILNFKSIIFLKWPLNYRDILKNEAFFKMT